MQWSSSIYIFALVSTVLVIVSCGEAVEMTHTRPLAIAGGEVDDTHSAVVGIVVELGDGTDTICTGNLITRDLVLTAQHCVRPVTNPNVVCGDSTFGDVLPPENFYLTLLTTFPAGNEGIRRAEEVVLPGTGEEICGNDMALLRLRDDVPPSEATPLVPRIEQPVSDGETYTAVGYGETDGGGDSGTRRMLSGLTGKCAEGGCTNESRVKSNEFEGSPGTCRGDSGGAALDDNGQLVGVLSRGGANCDVAVYSGVASWKDWLVEQARSGATRGSYPVPGWAADDPVVDDPEMGTSGTPDAGPSTQTCASGDCSDAGPVNIVGEGAACSVSDRGRPVGAATTSFFALLLFVVAFGRRRVALSPGR